ncbi:UPF0041 domain protein [Eremomyces bilateralis CBS 781.70]|uniref:Mitochondrial pyruvate carrier n=1 Tax=Eremomyces bilateralis CBS 781.70 TaxID=1392243 RepID=A0A6G1GCY6_9PEZI|nr:UPF0041 domain protein [Eremomyces bilateralis CBS 781.70]KAF1815948.1 UPF0041 domain protein [Eremomyces bilateralis CBS 781.70]
MAMAAVKVLNSRIRSNPYLDYVCSTHFWGPASNFGIPLAAIVDFKKDPEIISGRMTVALTIYSAVFARYAMAVQPKNYLLFGCHVINFTSQAFQGFRYYNYWHMGGREQTMKDQAAQPIHAAAEKIKEAADKSTR